MRKLDTQNPVPDYRLSSTNLLHLHPHPIARHIRGSHAVVDFLFAVPAGQPDLLDAKRLAIIAKTTLPSTIVRSCSMQFRGPCPNGLNAPGGCCATYSVSSHRSGMN